MKNRIALFLSALAFITPLCASATKQSTQVEVNSAHAASIQSETQKIRSRDFALAPLKNKQDVRRYLAQEHIGSPLSVLNRNSAQRFTESIEFNERGVTTFSYKELSGLSIRQAYAILSLLGIQDATASVPGLRVESEVDRAILSASSSLIQPAASKDPEVDYGDYRCAGRGTCQKSIDFICTGNC
ncbi:hypothetical protein VDF13_10665 [Xanthomonas campestris pv. raphani]|uniref:hypothetical protein n=1 Tax=Xanthomonas campestris TaxID=339 RepID=UPI001E564D1D|nr:hypothetical protein [Xanthomonas campestris]MCC8484640.1 hypothetical protein [Xanthomonas campestris]MEA9650608.1 hypothetical protein [Xanthomonas campestris pv. raphani]MEA9743615.1 hypothetical protein [Xanthomonas campestris pv. raphani]MEA9767620.1 hypothetical protein [Xanthomonas campestris pv. raphani]MEA9869427.1 hypothetical protein [Xanthomonas campestris pv. raphani]